MNGQNFKNFFRTTVSSSTKLCTKDARVKGIEICSNKESCNSQKEDNRFFSPYQRYDIIVYVYLFKLFSQVSDVAHGPLVVSSYS